MRRGGRLIRKPPYSAAPDARPHQVVERKGGVERHVRFVLVLAQPGGHVRVAVVAVLVEDHDHRAHFAMDLLKLAHVDAALVPVADGLAHVDAVQHRGGERLHARRAPRRECSCPSSSGSGRSPRSPGLPADRSRCWCRSAGWPIRPGTFSFLRGFRPTGRRRRLVLGSRRRRRMRRVSSQTSSPEMRTVGRFAGGLLRRIAARRLPDFPGVVVVDHAARRHRQIEEAGGQSLPASARLRV